MHLRTPQPAKPSREIRYSNGASNPSSQNDSVAHPFSAWVDYLPKVSQAVANGQTNEPYMHLVLLAVRSPHVKKLLAEHLLDNLSFGNIGKYTM